MRRFALLALLAGCDSSAADSTGHLRALGFTNVICNGEARGEATCVADGHRFRCVVADPNGCAQHAVACERFTVVEKP